MNQVMIDLWPILIPLLLAAVGWQWRENHALKIRVAVLETTVENMSATLNNIHKRQDSQSKKQDDILDRLSSMETEILNRMGDQNARVASLSSDLKALHDLILISDKGVKINRQ